MSSKRSRRYTSSRSGVGQRRRPVATGDYSEEENTTVALGKNWFFQQSPMSQVYYVKVIASIVFGTIVGIFYNFNIIADNWFIFPFIALAAVIAFTRYVLKITKDDLDDLRLIAWSGTISLFIGFIATSALIYNIVWLSSFMAK